MVLLIRPHEMAGLISMKEAIKAVEESFREWAQWPGSNVGLQQGGFIRERRRELDDETFRRADRIVVCSREQSRQDQQADLYDRVEKGLLRWDQVVELPEILSGKVAGRTGPQQITLFKNNAGQGVSDVALGAVLYRHAKEQGVGIELDFDGAEYQITPTGFPLPALPSQQG